MDDKLVSIVVPTIPKRNKYLMGALDSVRNQTYKNIEIIVVSDDRISATQARNEGIRKAKGDFIAFLDDDDKLKPTKIEEQVWYMLYNPDCPLVVTHSLDKRFGRTRINKPPKTVTHKMILKAFNLSSTSTYMVRRSSLEKIAMKYDLSKIRDKCGDCNKIMTCWHDFDVGIWCEKELICDDIRYLLRNQHEKQYFDESFPSAQEYDLAIRLSQLGDIHCVPKVLVTQGVSEGQISENWNKKIKGIISISRKYHKEYKIRDYVKTVGVLGLFAMGFVVGNRIYKVIIPIKEMYEK